MEDLAARRTRLAAMALVAGGIMAIAGYVITGTVFGSGDDRFTEPLWAPLYSIALAGSLLSLLGLPAIFAAHRERMPRLTLVGYVGTFVALATLNIGEGVIEGFVKPYLVTHGGIPETDPTALVVYFTVAFLFTAAGLVCLGIAVIRADVLPRWVGWAFIAAVPFSMIGQSLPGPLVETADYLVFVGLITIGWGIARPMPYAVRRSISYPSLAER
jgi:hypothetical protein